MPYKIGQLDHLFESSEPQADYTASIDPKTILKDPRVLQDLREYYREQGDFFADDEQLIELFYSDKTWGDINSVGAIGEAMDSISASPEQRERMRRIDSVWRQLPNFWQEGGYGAKALPHIGGALLFDPVNVIPGVAAYKAGGIARLARLQGA